MELLKFHINRKYIEFSEIIRYDCEDILLELNDIGINTKVNYKYQISYWKGSMKGNNPIMIRVKNINDLENNDLEIVVEVTERLTDYISKYK